VALAVGAGGTAAVDSEVNPCEVSAEQYGPASMSTSKHRENKTEADRDRPAVRLSKWSGDAGMTIRYDAKRWASAPCSPTASSATGATQEMHAYPLQPKEGLEDGGFEIEIIRWEKPKSNVFAFPIEDAQDLDFFDQPKPSAEEIPEGTVRPESVTGSYAVNHKTKVDHPVGDTIYAPGKARHIYRPNEDRIGRSKLGQCSVWQGLVATSAPQEPVARNSGSQLSGIPPRGRLQG
jgi:hypothetical protein